MSPLRCFDWSFGNAPCSPTQCHLIIFIVVGTERTWREIEGRWLVQIADQDPTGHQLWLRDALGAS